MIKVFTFHLSLYFICVLRFFKWIPCAITLTQPQRVHPPCRIRRVLIQVLAAHQADRILGSEAPYCGIIVAEPVVVKAGFFIVILTLEAQRIVSAGTLAIAIFCAFELAPGTVLAHPDEIAVAVSDFQRCAKVVGLEVVKLGCQGLIAGIARLASPCLLFNCLEARFQLRSGDKAVGFEQIADAVR